MCDLYYNEPMAPLDSRRGPLVVDQGPFPVEAIFTYDVTWMANEDTEWDQRWEMYMDMGGRYEEEIHWYALGTGLLALLLVACFLGVGVRLSFRPQTYAAAVQSARLVTAVVTSLHRVEGAEEAARTCRNHGSRARRQSLGRGAW